MYPHLISVIFKSEGGEGLGVLSIAVLRPWPKEDNGAKGAKVAAIAVLDKNDLLEVEFAILSGLVFLILPGAVLKIFLYFFFWNRKLIDMDVQPFREIFLYLLRPAGIYLASCIFTFL